MQRGRAEDHRLFTSSGIEQTVCEDMPAFGVRADLSFVDGDESVANPQPVRRLRRAAEIVRLRWLYAFLSGD